MIGRMINFKTDDPDKFVEKMESVSKNLTAKRTGRSNFQVNLRLARLSRTALFSVNLKNASVSDPNPRDFIGVTIPLRGRFMADRKKSFEPGTAHVLNIKDPFNLTFPQETDILVSNFYKPLITKFSSNLFNDEKSTHSQSLRRLNLKTPAGNIFLRYLNFIWSELCFDEGIIKSKMITEEIENSLYAMFAYVSADTRRISQSRYNYDSLFDHARHAETYIMDKLQEPMSAADIAKAANISYPTLYRAFIKYNNTTPMQFVRQRRLEAVRKELIAAVPNQVKVTEVAMKYGFWHLGQFSAAYKKAFGERPSETLRR